MSLLIGIIGTGAVSVILQERAQRREDALRKERQAREDQIRAEQRQDWVSQKWWDRKADAYTDIVDALWHIRQTAAEAMEPSYGPSEGPSRKDAPDDRNFRKDIRNLKKLGDVGRFVVSDEIAAALTEFWKRVGPVEDHPDVDVIIETHYGAAKECLEVVTPAALKDLGLM